MTLVEFLLARIAEDEADANLCIHPYGEGVTPPTVYASHEGWPQGRAWYEDGWSSDESPHLSRWSPARVLAECEAKRAIVKLHKPEPIFAGCRHCGKVHGPKGDTDPDALLACPECASGARLDGACSTLLALAPPYVDHPDYREEWRP